MQNYRSNFHEVWVEILDKWKEKCQRLVRLEADLYGETRSIL